MRRYDFWMGNVIFLVLLSISNRLTAQPDFSSRQKIAGITIYKDHKDPQRKYYEPSGLQLKRTGSGAPEFDFLDMRYTGTACANDVGEKRFMSLVSFGVVRDPMSSDTLKSIEETLGFNRVRWAPLPISKIQAQLILAPLDTNEDKVVVKGNLEASSNTGLKASGSSWIERTFAVRLSEQESQILRRQIQEKQLSISLSYTYYANFMEESAGELSGSPQLRSELSENLEMLESINAERIVRSDVLPIYIDVEAYPKTVQQIDLNEQIPPAYAGIEVRCYDFTDGLRPDLFMKTVEIEAKSVQGEQIITVSTKFRSSTSDLNVVHLSFPYAIYVDTPMRYRVTEWKNTGERKTLPWRTKSECNALIDVTTDIDVHQYAVRHLELEIDHEVLSAMTYDTAKVIFYFTFDQKTKTKEMILDLAPSEPLQHFKLVHDKGAQVVYSISTENNTGETRQTPFYELHDDYMYISDF
ncbi:MAG: hypothetical protein AAGF77_00005 [Bacteroidota bacterium]